MTFKQLQEALPTPIFTHADVVKLFPAETSSAINIQLSRMIKRGELIGIKRGLYAFAKTDIDEFVIANKLYTPSYVSLESALSSYGIIPDVAVNVTSVTPVTSKNITTPLGVYSFSKLARELFFGYKKVLDEHSGLYYQIAEPEKALLDYLYIRKIGNLWEARIDLSGLDQKRLLNYATLFPSWVRRIILYE